MGTLLSVLSPLDGNAASRGWKRSVIWLSATFLACTVTSHAAPDPEAPIEDKTSVEEQAQDAFEQGYLLHLAGRYGEATTFYRKSIAALPTAEAHTFLGWSLSYLGQLEEAIVECKKAIEIDPDFGNPYNDIGVYLIDLGRSQESIPWFKQAIQAKRYCCYHYSYFNLGRVLLHRGDIEGARAAFQRALQIEPRYRPAMEGLELIEAMGTKAI
ncbi:MAG: tetratricopeptide repeat protein [Arenicellales bacterium]|nr:tetratricopeptide repeat protein [Arenicellales bacterium]